MRKLEDGENLIREIRRHPLIFIIELFFIICLGLLPLGLFLVGDFFVDYSLVIPSRILALGSFLYSLWLVAIWVFIFIAWTDYYLDVWDITTKRIIDFDYKGFFRYETTSIRFEKIQDITIQVNGLFANIFKFGDIRVQTAGETSHEFIIRDVAHPEEVKRVILGQYERRSSGVGNIS